MCNTLICNSSYDNHLLHWVYIVCIYTHSVCTLRVSLYTCMPYTCRLVTERTHCGFFFHQHKCRVSSSKSSPSVPPFQFQLLINGLNFLRALGIQQEFWQITDCCSLKRLHITGANAEAKKKVKKWRTMCKSTKKVENKMFLKENRYTGEDGDGCKRHKVIYSREDEVKIV